MRNINKIVQTVLIEEKTWKQELHTFISSYRANPHTTSCHTPNELLFGRSMHVNLPEFPDFLTGDFALHQRDQQARRIQKDFSDTRCHFKASNIQPGDCAGKAWTTQQDASRSDLGSNEVTDVKGPTITMWSPCGCIITCNSSFMKAVHAPVEPSVPPVTECTWPSLEQPGSTSMARPTGTHSLSLKARPSSVPPSALAHPPGTPHSTLARPCWSPPGQSTHHVLSPRFEPETPESSLASCTRPPDCNQGYSLR